eukprot:10814027-Alexandrium_andersonii.AAC.2
MDSGTTCRTPMASLKFFLDVSSCLAKRVMASTCLETKLNPNLNLPNREPDDSGTLTVRV